MAALVETLVTVLKADTSDYVAGLNAITSATSVSRNVTEKNMEAVERIERRYDSTASTYKKIANSLVQLSRIESEYLSISSQKATDQEKINQSRLAVVNSAASTYARLAEAERSGLAPLEARTRALSEINTLEATHTALVQQGAREQAEAVEIRLQGERKLLAAAERRVAAEKEARKQSAAQLLATVDPSGARVDSLTQQKEKLLEYGRTGELTTAQVTRGLVALNQRIFESSEAYQRAVAEAKQYRTEIDQVTLAAKREEEQLARLKTEVEKIGRLTATPDRFAGQRELLRSQLGVVETYISRTSDQSAMAIKQRITDQLQAIDPAVLATARLTEELDREKAALDRLNAVYSETFRRDKQLATAQSELNKLVAAGRMTDEEAKTALDQLTASLNHETSAVDNNSRALRQNRQHMVNFIYQTQDIGISLASGQNPLTVLIQQLPQLTAGSGGTANVLRMIREMVTPVRTGVALVAATLATATAAWWKYDDAVRAIDTSLLTTSGRIRGSKEDLVTFAKATAGAAEVSKFAALDMTKAFIDAGAISKDTVAAAIESVKKLHYARGIKEEEAIPIAAGFIKNPEELIRTLKDMNVPVFDLMKSFEEAGTAVERTNVLNSALERLNSTLDGVGNKAKGAFSHFIDVQKRGISDALQSLGEGIDRFFTPINIPGVENTSDEIAVAAQRMVDDQAKGNALLVDRARLLAYELNAIEKQRNVHTRNIQILSEALNLTDELSSANEDITKQLSLQQHALENTLTPLEALQQKWADLVAVRDMPDTQAQRRIEQLTVERNILGGGAIQARIQTEETRRRTQELDRQAESQYRILEAMAAQGPYAGEMLKIEETLNKLKRDGLYTVQQEATLRKELAASKDIERKAIERSLSTQILTLGVGSQLGDVAQRRAEADALAFDLRKRGIDTTSIEVLQQKAITAEIDKRKADLNRAAESEIKVLNAVVDVNRAYADRVRITEQIAEMRRQGMHTEVRERALWQQLETPLVEEQIKAERALRNQIEATRSGTTGGPVAKRRVEAEQSLAEAEERGVDVSTIRKLKMDEISASIQEQVAALEREAAASTKIMETTVQMGEAAGEQVRLQERIAKAKFDGTYSDQQAAAWGKELSLAREMERRNIERTLEVQLLSMRTGAKEGENAAKRVEIEAQLVDLKRRGIDVTNISVRLQELLTEQMKEQAKQIAESVDPLLRYENQLRKIKEAYSDKDLVATKSNITDKQATKAVQEAYKERLQSSREWKDGATLAIEEYLDENTNYAKMAAEAWKQGFGMMEDSLVDMVATGKLSFRSLADDVIRQLYRMTVQQTIMAPIAQLMQGAFFPLPTLASATTSGMASIPGPAAGFGMSFHSGGIVGKDGTERAISPAWYLTAPRYHDGGIPGLLPNEIPAILEKGERVIPKNSSTGNAQITVINNFTANANGQFDRSSARQAAAGVSQMLASSSARLN